MHVAVIHEKIAQQTAHETKHHAHADICHKTTHHMHAPCKIWKWSHIDARVPPKYQEYKNFDTYAVDSLAKRKWNQLKNQTNNSSNVWLGVCFHQIQLLHCRIMSNECSFHISLRALKNCCWFCFSFVSYFVFQGHGTCFLQQYAVAERWEAAGGN